MIGSSFKNQMHNVIDLFESYKQKRGDTNDGVNFDLLDARIESLKSDNQSLSKDALNKQLHDILERIKVGYQSQLNQIDDFLKLKKISKKSPQEFENKFVRFKEKQKGYETLIQVTKEEFKEKCIREKLKINNIKINCREILFNLYALFDIEKMLMHASQTQDELNLFASQFTKELVDSLNKKLETEKIIFDEIYKITLPQVELDELILKHNGTIRIRDIAKPIRLYTTISKSKLNDAENDSFIRAIWNRESRQYEFYSEGQPLNEKPDLLWHLQFGDFLDAEFNVIRNNLTEKMDEVLDLYISYFEKKIEDIKNNLMCLIEIEKKEKIKNGELILEIKELELKKGSIRPELSRIEEILEDLK